MKFYAKNWTNAPISTKAKSLVVKRNVHLFLGKHEKTGQVVLTVVRVFWINTNAWPETRCL